MRAAGVDFLTIGQYLQPTPKHHRVDRFVTPEEFADYERAARGKGFAMVSATRSPARATTPATISRGSGSRGRRPPRGADPRSDQRNRTLPMCGRLRSRWAKSMP